MKMHANLVIAVATALIVAGCASDTKNQNLAKEAAARYWTDKAYPGKAYDVQVIEAEKTDDGQYRVKGIVDGETRVGTFSPESETFSEGYYSLAHEREKRVAELEEAVKYWKEKSEDDEKEIYKMKVQLAMARGESVDGIPAPATAMGSSPASVAVPPVPAGAIALPPPPPAAKATTKP